MSLKANMKFYEKSKLIIQNEIRSLNSSLVRKKEALWISCINNLLNNLYMTLNQKMIDNEMITKEFLAEYFFQELELKNNIQTEMIKRLNRPLYKTEEQLIENIIRSLETNIIALWMEEE